ncbi:MAG TPA: hypothetical protein VKU82_08390 [Planctomycetaceae bacterium]|nr:hypothetical protein [Planctomycetaceae bacterium]
MRGSAQLYAIHRLLRSGRVARLEGVRSQWSVFDQPRRTELRLSARESAQAFMRTSR